MHYMITMAHPKFTKVELEKLFESDTGELVKWYASLEPAVQERFRMRTYNALIERGAYDELAKFWAALCNGAILSINTVEEGILALRYLLAKGQYQDGLVLYQSLLSLDQHRKRLLDLLIKHCLSSGNREEACALVHAYFGLYEVEDSDLILALQVPGAYRQAILERAVRLPLKVQTTSLPVVPVGLQMETSSAKGILSNGYELRKLDFTCDESNILLGLLRDAFKSKRDYDTVMSNARKMQTGDWIVVDGANIMFYGTDQLSRACYFRLDAALRELESFGNVVLVLHERHFDGPLARQADISRLIRQWSTHYRVHQTPRNSNDDLYSILYAIAGGDGTRLVTNDKFCDHIYQMRTKVAGLNLLAQWRAENIVEYAYDYGSGRHNFQWHWPDTWSHRVQATETHFYIPTEISSKWISCQRE